MINPFVMMMIAEKLDISATQLMVLSKYQNLQAADVNVDLLRNVAADLGFHNPSATGLEVLVSQFVTDKPADMWAWLSQENILKEVVTAFKGEELPHIVQCPYCRMTFLP